MQNSKDLAQSGAKEVKWIAKEACPICLLRPVTSDQLQET